MTPQERRHDEDDQQAVDRAFAELVAGYHLTADRPDPLPPSTSSTSATSTGRSVVDPLPVDSTWADEHPLFRFEAARDARTTESDQGDQGDDILEERYEPEPAPAVPRPPLPVLLGWIGVGIAAATILGASFGLPLPVWVGWLALIGFLGGFAVLLTRLPRHRPPGSGDGAVV